MAFPNSNEQSGIGDKLLYAGAGTVAAAALIGFAPFVGVGVLSMGVVGGVAAAAGLKMKGRQS